MAISDKTRKILWGRSGNLCAFCRRGLIADATPQDAESVVGDECHIIGQTPRGPRGSPDPGMDIDAYDNLILLCKVHHKLVDDQLQTYSVEKLRAMKAQHELWVKQKLSDVQKSDGKRPRINLLPRLATGRDVASVIGGALAHHFDHDDLEDDETQVIASFLQTLEDYVDIWGDLMSGQQVEARSALGRELRELEAHGFLVFGAQQKRRFRVGSDVMDWPVAVVVVVRSSSAGITEMGQLATMFSDDNQIVM